MKARHFVCRMCFGAALGLGVAWAQEPAPLMSAQAVRELSAAEANRPRRVELAGVVLGLAESRVASVVIQDATDAIYVTGQPAMIAGLRPGDLVRLRGRTTAGGFAPYVQADEIEKTGTGRVPEPRRVSSEELFSKGLDAQWIVVTGVVRNVREVRAADLGRDPDPVPAVEGAPSGAEEPMRRMKLTLAMGDRLVPVLLYGRWSAEQLVDADVEIRGVCFNLHNAERQFLNPSILIPRGTDIRIVRRPPHGPFDAPAVPSRSLFGFKREGLSLRRVRVDGVVLHQVIGAGLWIRDGDKGLFVQSDQRTPVAPGDRVQVAGFPERGPYSAILGDAIYRTIERGAEPSPAPLSDHAMATRHNADLVAIEGMLAGQKETAEGLLLRLDWQGTEIAAIYSRNGDAAAPLPRLEPGSRLSVAGICVFSPARDLPLSGMFVPDKFSVLMRRASDLAVVQAAPWWTGERVALLLSAVIVVLAAILATLFIVSRRKLARERAHRELEVSTYAARLAERSRMARDLHDTVAQGLGAILLQLELAANRATTGQRESAEHVSMAQQLVRSSMVEVRSFIRNLRTQTQQDVELASALEDLLRTAVEGTPIEPRFQLEGVARKLPAEIEAQVIRIAQEAISNAVRHSGANVISLHVQFTTDELIVVVADDGAGFDHAVEWGERLHFGLLGMKERAELVSATLNIAAAADRGTCVTLRVPRDATVKDSLSL